MSDDQMQPDPIELLRRANPVDPDRLPPGSEARLRARVLEDTMATNEPATQRRTSRPRSFLPALYGAGAMALVVAVVVATGLLGPRGTTPTGSAAPSSARWQRSCRGWRDRQPARDPRPGRDGQPRTRPAARSAAAGWPCASRCTTSRRWRTASGRSMARRRHRLDGNQVTFAVNHWFREGRHGGATVTVTADGMTSESGLLGGPGLVVGGRYLVTGEDEFAWSCGFTQYWNESTAADWARVLGGQTASAWTSTCTRVAAMRRGLRRAAPPPQGAYRAISRSTPAAAAATAGADRAVQCQAARPDRLERDLERLREGGVLDDHDRDALAAGDRVVHAEHDDGLVDDHELERQLLHEAGLGAGLDEARDRVAGRGIVEDRELVDAARLVRAADLDAFDVLLGRSREGRLREHEDLALDLRLQLVEPAVDRGAIAQDLDELERIRVRAAGFELGREGIDHRRAVALEAEQALALGRQQALHGELGADRRVLHLRARGAPTRGPSARASPSTS